MRPTKGLWLLVLLLSSGSAWSEDAEKMVEHPARTSSRDIKVPKALVKTIEEEYRAFLKKNQVNSENIKRQLLNVSLELTQKKPVALHEDTRVVMPLGGGVVDLNEFVTPLRGAFFMKVVAKEESGADVPELRVFFVSHAKKRILDGEEYGAGCDKYMEITSFYNKKNSKNAPGFELYTADQRYLSAVGGTFVVYGFDKEALSVGSVTLTDSRYPDLFCE
jgi:hypothetical protein